MQIGDHLQSWATEPTKKSSNLPINARSHGKRRNRKEMKVDWTQELHKKFVRAVEQLGIDQAIPSKIPDLMKVDGLTRHNVASHLQINESRLNDDLEQTWEVLADNFLIFFHWVVKMNWSNGSKNMGLHIQCTRW